MCALLYHTILYRWILFTTSCRGQGGGMCSPVGCSEIPKYSKVVCFWPFSHYFSLCEHKKSKKSKIGWWIRLPLLILNLQRDRLKNTKENVVSWFFAFYAAKWIEMCKIFFHSCVCLIHTVLLIPILLWFVAFYVIWYMS